MHHQLHILKARFFAEQDKKAIMLDREVIVLNSLPGRRLERLTCGL
jgi:hypothetical protein